MSYQAGSHTYELHAGWGDLPDGYQFHRVAGVATDADDNVYVFNRSPQKMLIFERDGAFKTDWDAFFKVPHGIAIDSAGNVYTADVGTHLVEKHAPWGGLMMTLGTRDEPSDTGRSEGFLVERAAGPFNMCCAVAVNDAGEIFVADGYGNSRVHKFSPDGQLLLSWGEPGKGGPGEFHLPHGITIDQAGRLLICDRENNRIQIYDQQGNYLDMWDGFLQPTSIAQAPDGSLFVPELQHRVTVLSPDGEVIGRWGGERSREPGKFVAPHDVAVDSRGDVYIGEVLEGKRVQKFVRS
jgi:DNA-binding beta-propeller fold protein YncE